jgi:hypothetical protein
MKGCVLTVFLVVAGCGGPAGKPYHYPLDTVLRFDDVQVKATHNSYHIETSDLAEWSYTMQPLGVQLDRQGVRSIELDLHYLDNQDGKGWHFEVFHVVLADQGTTCQQFTDCLQAVKDWSDRYPGHVPIYIELEPKEGFDRAPPETVFSELEREILRVWPKRRIITPDEIRGAAPTLPAALASGWPTLDRLRGRVLFAFDNRAQVRSDYTRGLANLDGRLCFVDSDPTDPFGAISIQNDPMVDADAIAAALAAHLLVRTRSDVDGVQARAGDLSVAEAAFAVGAHFVSTDFPAAVAGLDYVVEVPGGTPARCNPKTAPAHCTSLAIEDPAFVGSGTP